MPVHQKGEWVFRSEFAKKYIAIGQEQGREQGLERGHAEAKADAILAVLEARGVPVPAEVARRVRAATDLASLDRWLRRAVKVARAEDLFAD